MNDALRSRFEKETYRASWALLEPHATRSALILVDRSLDLIDVAIAVAQDDGPRVHSWMSAAKLTRPTPTQVDAWKQEQQERFSVLIVQPYVLASRDAAD